MERKIESEPASGGEVVSHLLWRMAKPKSNTAKPLIRNSSEPEEVSRPTMFQKNP